MRSAVAAISLGCVCLEFATGQVPMKTQAGEMVLFESAGASRVVEKIRSDTQGVMVEILVEPGEMVKKGQILGHTELDATKLQLDLAQHAVESKGNVESTLGQAAAWTVAREETEELVRRHKVAESRLEWARAMEKMYRGTYQMQVEAENAQMIQYKYWKEQYRNRFFRAPVDGVVSEVLVEVGKPVTFATHVFTIGNDNTYAVPVTVPSALADSAVPNQTLPVRSSDGKSVTRAVVDSVMDDPNAADRKIIKLLIQEADFPEDTRMNLKGMKFDVLLPQAAQDASR